MVCPRISKPNNFIKLCCLSFMVGHVWAAEVGLTHLRAAVVKDGHTKRRIISAVSESFRKDEIDEK